MIGRKFAQLDKKLKELGHYRIVITPDHFGPTMKLIVYEEQHGLMSDAKWSVEGKNLFDLMFRLAEEAINDN